MHIASKEGMVPELMFSSECTPQLLSRHYASLSAMFSLLHSTTNENSRRSASTINPVNIKMCFNLHTSTINYSLESAVAITLCFQFCSACYTAYKHTRSASAINPVTTKNIDDSHLQMKPCIVLPRIDTLGCQQKEMGHKGRTKANP